MVLQKIGIRCLPFLSIQRQLLRCTSRRARLSYEKNMCESIRAACFYFSTKGAGTQTLKGNKPLGLWKSNLKRSRECIGRSYAWQESQPQQNSSSTKPCGLCLSLQKSFVLSGPLSSNFYVLGKASVRGESKMPCAVWGLEHSVSGKCPFLSDSRLALRTSFALFGS